MYTNCGKMQKYEYEMLGYYYIFSIFIYPVSRNIETSFITPNYLMEIADLAWKITYSTKSETNVMNR